MLRKRRVKIIREEEVKSTGKVEMDDIALRKIQRPHSEDYVDYEEVSK